jgi:hypothetical protein
MARWTRVDSTRPCHSCRFRGRGLRIVPFPKYREEASHVFDDLPSILSRERPLGRVSLPRFNRLVQEVARAVRPWLVLRRT